MKKILSLSLALVLLLAALGAGAVTPNFNGPFSFDFDTFKTVMTAFTASADPPYKWESEPLQTFGYDMYMMANSDETAALTAHMIDPSGNVGALEMDVFLPVSRTIDQETAAGEELGKIVAFGLLAAYYAENQSLPEDLDKVITDELGPIVNYINDLDSFSDADIEAGAATYGTVLGYPCALSLDKVDIDGTRSFMISFMVLPVSGSFTR